MTADAGACDEFIRKYHPRGGTAGKGAHHGNGAAPAGDMLEHVRAVLAKLEIGHDENPHDGAIRLRLGKCVFCEDGTFGKAAVFVNGDRPPSYFCQHESCAKHLWSEVCEKAGVEPRRRMNGASVHAEAVVAPLWTLPSPLTPERLCGARLTPDCIVQAYLYADVALLVSPGGVGKTTLMLYEAVHIALGRSLYGLPVLKPGPVLIISAEDPEEPLAARLRMICEALHLTSEELALVLARVRISDVVGTGLRLTRIEGDVVTVHPIVDGIIEEAKRLAPVLVVIDPAVSFGVGEARVNDAEQGLVEAARRIQRALGCCVRYVHHSGKANAREGTVDQYTSRGGSAFPDGSRMVTVLQPLDADKWRELTGYPLGEEESAIRLVRAKCSYSRPQPDILLRRDGYAFTATRAVTRDPTERLEADACQLIRYIESELKAGRKYTRTNLEASATSACNMPRASVRAALARLEASGKIVSVGEGKRGVGRFPCGYLAPADAQGITAETDEADGSNSPDAGIAAAQKAGGITAAALREKNGGSNSPPFFPPSLQLPPQATAVIGGNGSNSPDEHLRDAGMPAAGGDGDYVEVIV